VIITVAMVNELRKRSDHPMMECKHALVACDGDMARAQEWLRKGPESRMETVLARLDALERRLDALALSISRIDPL